MKTNINRLIEISSKIKDLDKQALLEYKRVEKEFPSPHFLLYAMAEFIPLAVVYLIFSFVSFFLFSHEYVILCLSSLFIVFMVIYFFSKSRYKNIKDRRHQEYSKYRDLWKQIKILDDQYCDIIPNIEVESYMDLSFEELNNLPKEETDILKGYINLIKKSDLGEFYLSMNRGKKELHLIENL